ncbi:PQQ-binding-like beta-propeller repeat protein [Streptomyces sp. NPDC091272]|uniref:protein kinase domain-containing protein n=1 Tax=Streptomyces sp. NPDC091272 TaxID=3365981 RepID=UPI0038115C96
MAAAASAAGPTQYHVVAPLGEGGTGRVQLARSPAGRLVALRTVHPHLAADPGFRERFRREVVAARAVDVRSAAAVLDCGTQDELPWLAVEFCAGPCLVDAISTLGPLDPAALGSLGAALAEALAAIHAAGLVHRCLGPSNVVVTRDGPKILDFGIAQDAVQARDDRAGGAGGRASGAGGAGGQAGTLGFVAPEQLPGGPDAEVGPPADVFALGALLALSSTGRNPYGSGTAAQVLHRTLHEPPDLVGVPGEEWPGFLRRCLAMEPADRPSVAEVLAWCAGRAGPPWWESEPITGAVREHEEATAELVAAETEFDEKAEEIPEAFRTPPPSRTSADAPGRRPTPTPYERRPRTAPAPHGRQSATPPVSRGQRSATPPASRGQRSAPALAPSARSARPAAPPVDAGATAVAAVPAAPRRRFLAWAGAVAAAVTGTTAAAVLLADDDAPPAAEAARSKSLARGGRQGITVWSRTLATPTGPGDELLLDGDALYVRTDRALTRLHPATGEVRWRYEAGGAPLSCVRPQGATVFVLRLPPGAPEIVALDAATGARRWSTGDPAKNPFRPPAVDEPAVESEGPSAHLAVSPAVVCLVTHATASTLAEQRATPGNRWRAYGFGARDGEPLWHRAGGVTGVPAVHQDGGRLAVATSERPVSPRDPAGGPLVVLRDRDGTVEREIENGSAHPQAHPGSSGFRHYPGRAAVEAVELATGKRRWSRPAHAGVSVTPAATAGLVHTGSQGDLRALDAATGRERWVRTDVRRVDGAEGAPPLVADGLLYASGPDPSATGSPGLHRAWGLHALDARTGAPVWAAPVEGLTGARAVAGGGLVHLYLAGTVRTLRGPADD